ncbi:c-type cytochrome [Phaeobacter marinintestinus]|uniref:c-type cytochrome n=1 Tax=Falsiphaeobacter marinintestinus TaxID=1492905 RepID=UPI0011B5F6FF|nr:c-type cytochrome [Phaeobacter marinintestinus]
MKKQIWWGAAAVVGLGVGGWALLPQEKEPAQVADALVDISLPASLTTSAQVGKTMFEAKCAACHGINAVGRNGAAPPLVHKIYEPSHHGNESFQRAVAMGVKSHHWRFGNMRPIEGLTRGDVTQIVAYIRELQRANGIN